MKPLKVFSLAVAGMLALAMSSAVSAAEMLGQIEDVDAGQIRFQWDAGGAGRDFEFIVDRNPNPSFFFDSSFFRIDDVTDLLTNETLRTIYILHDRMGGGFVVQPGNIAEAWAIGQRLYTGSLSQPSLTTGTFVLEAGEAGYWGGTLTISQFIDSQVVGKGPTTQDPTEIVTPPLAVPEPSTWLLLLLGFFALGALLRHQPLARRSLVALQ